MTEKNENSSLFNNQIEATMIQVKDSTELKRSLSSLSNHSSISTSSSSSSNNSSIYDDALEENNDTSRLYSQCACQDLLVSTDSEHCGLCDQPIPIVQDVQKLLLTSKENIKDINVQIQNKKITLQSHEKKFNTLKTELVQRQASLVTMTNKIQSLHQDIEIVQLKHKDEIAHTIAIEHSKKLVENEVHDLTQKLFEEANSLVLAEKQEKIAIKIQHDKVSDDLKLAESQLEQVQLELKELRNDMAEKDQEPQQLNPQSSFSSFITTHENYVLRAQLDMASLQNDITQPIEINPEYHQQVTDTALVEEFKQFSTAIKSTGLLKMLTLPFMKSCSKMDIEPCLRFGPNPRLSSKKIMDAILAKSCLTEVCPPEFFEERMKASTKVEAPKAKIRLWDRFASSSPIEVFNGCQACGRTLAKEESWRFRISYFDEWALIDRFCFERIASVIDFYSFLRKLKADGYKDVDSFQVYQEFSRHQLQMFLARMGACATLLDEFGLDSKRIGYLLADSTCLT